MYCTDVARMIQAPIFHVNGDDPEACIRVARLAFAFRQEFNKDVVIDIVCYRRRGHNEGDDPSFTQPLMYDLIEKKRSIRKLYTEALIGRGDITVEDAEEVMTALPAAVGERLQGSSGRERADRRRGPRVPAGAGVPGQVRGQARHADLDGDAEEDRRRPHDLPGGLHRPPQGDAAAATAGGRHHPGTHRLGDRGDPGLRFAADRGPHRAAHRPGQSPGHLRAALRLGGRPRDRRIVGAAEASGRRPGQVPHLRLAAQRVRGDGLRVRLFGRPSRGAGAVGGAVRRFRQRRPDDHRRVHLLRRGEVDAEVRGRAAAAARP